MKKYLLSACAIVLAVAFTAFTAPRFGSVTLEYTGPLFAMGDNSSPLDDTDKWDPASPTCTETGGTLNKLCKVIVTYPSTQPAEQDLINAIKARYEVPNPDAFTDGQTFQAVINSQTIDFQVELKVQDF